MQVRTKLILAKILVACAAIVGVGATAYAGIITWLPPAGVTSIVSGNDHSCELINGQVYCWGLNTNGQLGNNTTTASSTPVPVDTSGVLGGKTVTAIAAGASHTCAVANSLVYCWGLNSTGQLGNNSTTQSLVPVAVTTAAGQLSGKTVTAVAAGADHSCVVASAAVFCWGNNSNAQLGNGGTTQSLVPVTTTATNLSGKTLTSLTAGTKSTCILANAVAYCWGLNANGQVGNNSTTQANSPTAVLATGALSGKTLSSIVASKSYTCAVASSAAYCWGLNTNGQLGNNSTAQSTVPVAVNTATVLSGKNVTAISAENSHTCAVASGAAYCWGLNTNGQLGNNSTAQSTVPVTVSATGVMAGKTVTSVTAAGGFSCALAGSYSYCWGDGTSGRLGTGDVASSLVPLTVETNGPLYTEPYRFYDSAASTTPGTPLAATSTAASLTSAGQAFRLRTGISAGAVSSDSVQVEGGVDFGCALNAGTVYCWGGNSVGQLGNGNNTDSQSPVPILTTGALAGKTITALSVGQYHSCVLASGQPYCWGANWTGALGDGTTNHSNVPIAVNTSGVLNGKISTNIAAMGGTVCVLASGLPYCWGEGPDGQLGNGGTANSPTPVAVTTTGALAGKTLESIVAGDKHICGLSADRKIYCWGYGPNGQMGNNSYASSNVPVAVDMTGVLAGKQVQSLGANNQSTCALASNAIYCWGYGNEGQLGNGVNGHSPVPTAVTMSGALSGKTVTSVTSTCAVADGAAYCWGWNATGQVGNNSTVDVNVPTAVNTSGVLGGKVVAEIGGGAQANCAIASGGVYCWGSDQYGQLGNGGTSANSSVPVDTGQRYGGELAANVNQFKLQFAQKSAATCTLQSTGFADVTTTSQIAYTPTAGVTHGTSIPKTANDPLPAISTTAETFLSAAGNFSNPAIVPVGSMGLWDFSLKDNYAAANTNYCLRIVYASGSTIEQPTSFPEIKTAPGTLSVSIVDAAGVDVAAPSFAFAPLTSGVSCRSTTGQFGTSTQRLRVFNSLSTTGWNVSMAATAGSTALWNRSDNNAKYDFNDPSGSPAGCNSGSDGDGFAGQLTFNATPGTVTPQSGCAATGITKGASAGFVQGSTNAITLLTGSSSSQVNCFYELTGASMTQYIPGAQAAGDYSITMTATVVAQ